MIDKTERGLGGYNKRSDYGELDNSAVIKKDDTVIHATEEDKIYLSIVKCEITKLIGKRKEKRNWEVETFYKIGDENRSFFISDIIKQAKLKLNESLNIKEIIKIKAIGLIK